jgi:hypothetical protein
MIFIRHIKYPLDQKLDDYKLDENIQKLPAILPRSGMGFYLLDLFQVNFVGYFIFIDFKT